MENKDQFLDELFHWIIQYLDNQTGFIPREKADFASAVCDIAGSTWERLKTRRMLTDRDD